MRIRTKVLLAIHHVIVAGALLGAGAQAQMVKGVGTISLKSGESAELALYILW